MAIWTRLGAAVAGVWRLRGLRGLARFLAGKIYWSGRFVRFHVDLAEWTIAPPTPGVEAREGSFDELQRFRGGARVALEFHEDRLHGARRFYLGLVDGQVGHISWVYTHRDRTRQIRLRPGEIELNGAYTVRAFRGRGLLSAVERAILNDAKREGVRAAYTHVRVDNTASLRGVARTGFRPIGILTWRRVLGVSWTRFRPGGVPEPLEPQRREAPAVAT